MAARRIASLRRQGKLVEWAGAWWAGARYDLLWRLEQPYVTRRRQYERAGQL